MRKKKASSNWETRVSFVFLIVQFVVTSTSELIYAIGKLQKMTDAKLKANYY